MTTTTGTSKRTHRTGAGARINADHIAVYRVIAVLVIAAALSGMVMSWSALLEVATWLRLPTALSWTVPVGLDVPIATLAIASLTQRSRGRDAVARWFTALAVVFTALVAAACFLSVADASGLLRMSDWVGAVGKGLAPAITLVMVEVLGALVARPKRVVVRRKRKPAKPKATAPVRPVPAEVIDDAAA